MFQNYESKLLRINETMDKNFTVLLHPNMTMFENATTNFLESLQCYFNNITFSYVSFFDDTSESSICDTVNLTFFKVLKHELFLAQ